MTVWPSVAPYIDTFGR